MEKLLKKFTLSYNIKGRIRISHNILNATSVLNALDIKIKTNLIDSIYIPSLMIQLNNNIESSSLPIIGCIVINKHIHIICNKNIFEIINKDTENIKKHSLKMQIKEINSKYILFNNINSNLKDLDSFQLANGTLRIELSHSPTILFNADIKTTSVKNKIESKHTYCNQTLEGDILLHLNKKHQISYAYHLNTGLGEIHLDNVEFSYPLNGGMKPFGETFTIFFDSDHLNFSIFGKNISANAHLDNKNKEIKTLFYSTIPSIQTHGIATYHLNTKMITIDGSGEMINIEEFIKGDNQENPSYTPYKLDLNLTMKKIMLSKNGGLYKGKLSVHNDNIWSLPHIELRGQPYEVSDEKQSTVRKGFMSKTTDNRDYKANIIIDGTYPTRKLLIQTNNIEKLCSALEINLPISKGEAWIEGYIEKSHIEGKAYIYNIETTHSLGLLSLMRFVSIGHWLNMILQPNQNFWPTGKASWVLYPNKLSINDSIISNIHQTLTLNGDINFDTEKLLLNGRIIPHSLWHRIFGTTLSLDFGTPFSVFGATSDPQVNVENKGAVIPFFLP